MEPSDVKFYSRKRYVVVFFTFLGMACFNILRTNLSIALVRMTLTKRSVTGNETIVQNAEFSWTAQEKGILLSLAFFGYMLAPIGGFIGSNIGYSTVFGFCVGANSIICFLSPTLLRCSIYVYGISRIIEGIFEGTIMSVMPSIYLYWSSPKDRCRMITISHAGSVFGSTVNYILCGFIAENFGWEAVFYIPGGIALSWTFIWFTFVTNHPADNKFVSEAEKVYLTHHSAEGAAVKKKLKYPWKQIVKSKPVWAICNESFTIMWVFVFLLSGLPFYLKDIGYENLTSIGLISSLPHLCAFIAEPICGFVNDLLRSKSSLGKDRIHKMLIGLSQFGIAANLIITGFFLSFTGSILSFIMDRIFLIICESCLQVLIVDAFGRYSGFIKGLCTMCNGIGALLCPILMGFMTTNHTRSEWNLFILVISGFNIWSLIIFFLCGSGELQSWAAENEEKSKKFEVEDKRFSVS